MKTYFVWKGFHYSNFLPCIKCTKDSMVFKQTLVFDQSCAYDIDEPSCVNKLFGFCFGFGVHKNSIRFGWSYDKNFGDIIIWKYVYENVVLKKNMICRVSIGDQHNYRIEAVRRKDGLWNIDFVMDGATKAVHWNMNADSCFVTTLGLYFGGNSRAPHTIKVKRLA